MQKEVFGTELKYINSVQTNLTVLTDRHIEFLKGEEFFQDTGVSFDVYGEQRVDTKGQLRTDMVLANMQKLVDNRISFGAIAVLARDTLPVVKQIYRFFDGINVSYRMLAYYRTIGSEQAQRHGLEFDELVGAYKDLFHEWLASETATNVDPIEDFVQYAISHVTQSKGEPYDRAERERVFIVDVNGEVFNVLESYEPEFCYGNLFDSPMTEIAASQGRRKSVASSQERTRKFCEPCPYFGSCPGVFVSNATPIERGHLQSAGCPVRAVLDHMVEVFNRTELKDFILKTHADSEKREERAALSVG
jgi:uncharacterized protein